MFKNYSLQKKIGTGTSFSPTEDSFNSYCRESVLSASNFGNQNVCKTKVDDLEYLVHCMKERMCPYNRSEKLQILTLIPTSWSIRKEAEEFSVPKRTIQIAKLLRGTKSIKVFLNYTHTVK